MNYTSVPVSLLALLSGAGLCAAQPALPENVLVFDGVTIVNAEEGQAMLKAGFGDKLLEMTEADQRARLRQLLQSKAQDLIAGVLFGRAGIVPSEELAFQVTLDALERLPEGERRRLEEEKGESIRDFAAKASKLPQVQFTTAGTMWIMREFDDRIQVNDEELQAFYSANLSMFKIPEDRKVAFIALKRSPANDRAAASAAMQLMQGERFDLLKDKYNEAGPKELELLAADRMIAKASEDMRPGGVEVKTILLPEYAVVIKLAGYRPERILSFEEAKPTLKRSVRDLKVRMEVNRAIIEEAAKHKIQINLGDDLP